ncbi:hypothetical protein MUO71_08085 [Candidatus Bathyarchaeota archaeon]|nr:hypothetical protein [Candidatus Bathyarchaeota archaeon]
MTLRDRDSWRQVRSKLDCLPELLNAYFRHKIDFEGLGKLIER